jgi:hypothetical protein
MTELPDNQRLMLATAHLLVGGSVRDPGEILKSHLRDTANVIRRCLADAGQDCGPTGPQSTQRDLPEPHDTAPHRLHHSFRRPV